MQKQQFEMEKKQQEMQMKMQEEMAKFGGGNQIFSGLGGMTAPTMGAMQTGQVFTYGANGELVPK